MKKSNKWIDLKPDDPNGIVDLKPNEWKSEREKQREPFFGSGAPEAIAYLVGLVITVTVIHFCIR
jgi:hypothetical protein